MKFKKEEGNLMGFMDKLNPFNTETRAGEEYSGGAWVGGFSQSFFKGSNTHSEDELLSIPIAKACVDKITDTIGQLPIYLYKQNDEGDIERIYDDYRERLLNDESSAFGRGNNLKKHMVKDVVLRGSSYVLIDEVIKKGKSTIEGLHPIPKNRVEVKPRYKNGIIPSGADILIYPAEGAPSTKPQIYAPHELIIVTNYSDDGLTGKGVLELNGKTIRQALLVRDHITHYHERAGIPMGMLKIGKRLKKAEADQLRTEWAKEHSGAANNAKTYLLQDGMDYVPLSPQNIDEEKMLKSVNEAICLMFNVPYDIATGKQTDDVALLRTLSPIIEKNEAGINYSLLTESEKQAGYFFRFDVSEMIRMNPIQKADYVDKSINSGAMSVNEGRAYLDLPKIPDHDYLSFAPGTTMIDINTGELVGQGLNDATTSANASDDDKNEVDTNEN